MYQVFMFPGQTTEQNRRMISLVFRKQVLDRLGKMLSGLKIDTHLSSEPRSLLFQLSPD
jgi:hypothetical protein